MTDPPRPLEDAPAAELESSEPAATPRRRATRARRTTQDRPARPAAAPPRRVEAPSSPEVEPPPRMRPLEPGVPVPERHAVRFEEHLIDPDVHKVVRRLVRHGYEAYLVGGCVRDLMLGRVPKDFDVATSARPEEVRELFRNSRVIGRRFRLVHVLFGGGKVIEVATFRRNPKDEVDDDVEIDGDARPAKGSADLLIRTDNVFGKTHEDALRRDFTINALFYDVESHEILDYAHGMRDLTLRVVNTIGEPEVRFAEDPVRILRAIKFAGRLDLGLAPSVYDAIVLLRDSLALAARPRVSEEILRLLRGGNARRTVFIAFEIGVLDVLLPEVASLLYDDELDEGPRHRLFRALEYVDRETKQRGPLDDAVLWTLLLLEPLREASEGARDKGLAVRDCLEPVIERLAVPRRHADAVRRLVGILPRIQAGKAGRFMHTDLFELAVVVAQADAYARGVPPPRLPARTGDAEPDRPLPRMRRRPQARR